jgi:hypothetical protein
VFPENGLPQRFEMALWKQWKLALARGMFEQVALVIRKPSAVGAGIAASFIVPYKALWKWTDLKCGSRHSIFRRLLFPLRNPRQAARMARRAGFKGLQSQRFMNVSLAREEKILHRVWCLNQIAQTRRSQIFDCFKPAAPLAS